MPEWLNRNILAFSIASFFSDISQNIVLSVLPDFVNTLVGSVNGPFLLGIVTGVAESINYLSRLFFGWLSDRYNRHRLFIATGYSLTGIFSAMLAFATQGWHVVLFRSLTRFGKGMREPTRDSMLAASVSHEHYGKAFVFNRSSDTFGGIIGLLLVQLLALYFGDRSLFLLSAVPAAASVLCIALFTVVPKEFRNGRSQVQLSIKMITQKLSTQCRWFFSLSFVHITLLLLFVQHVRDLQGASAVQFSAFLFIVFNVARFLCEYSIGALSDWWGRTPTLAIFGFGLFGFIAFLLLLPFTSTLFFVLIFSLAGLSQGTVYTLEKAAIADLAEPEIRGFAYGFLYVVRGFGMLIAGSFVGYLWTTFGVHVAFFYMMTVSWCATVSLITFYIWYYYYQKNSLQKEV